MAYFFIRVLRLFNWLLLLCGAVVAVAGFMTWRYPQSPRDARDCLIVMAIGAAAVLVAFAIDSKARPAELRLESERRERKESRGFDILPPAYSSKNVQSVLPVADRSANEAPPESR